jgi:hypothetical protein
VKSSDEWLTPPAKILEPLGGWQANDIDPAAMVDQPWPTAKRHFTVLDNGLLQEWSGEAWLNPPYSQLRRWLARLAAHGRGIALVFAKTDTVAFSRYVWPCAHAVHFIQGRLPFHQPNGLPAIRADGRPVEARHAAVLCAYGELATDRLAASGIAGRFVPLILQRYVFGERVVGTWEEEVLAYFRGRSGPVRNDELYLAFASHPKAKTNSHLKAKIRQVLQECCSIRPVDRGVWEMAS